jgi:dienelactone hydrolase
MKISLQAILAVFFIGIGIATNAQTRYLDDVFTEVTVTSDVVYANNISILPLLQGLTPEATDLVCDIYEPTGDSVANRPVIIVAHTGSFLPAVINGQPTGTKTDSSIVEQCTRWAKKGYVAVAMTNRLGWNPSSTDQNTRTSTLLQASYRGIQDARSMIRFMRQDEANGNNYGIDGSKIVMGGQGTGAYIALGVATLDTSAELFLPKFLDLTDPANPVPYIFPPVFGNIWGTDMGYIPVTDTAGNSVLDSLGNPVMAPFALPNNVGYSSDISLAFNLGGALADISWLQPGDVPIVSFHCENDPYAPIDTGDVIVPTTGDFVVEVMGSRTVQHYSNQYLNNDVFVQAGLTDAFTTSANVNNNGLEGFNMFNTPTPSVTPNAFGELEEEQGSPWDWWDNTTYDVMFSAVNGAPAGYGAANSLLGNPNMSSANGNLYIDTIQGYLNPRIYVALGLNSGNTGITNVIESSTEMYPNPAKHSLNIVSYATGINSISIFNLNGQEILNTTVNANQIRINTSSLSNGVYIVDIKSNNHSVKRKLVIE